jgi:bifunctional DNA-binding transcriptional regulator/antitoxin component of YhaV-PrlF toxin-antitoxin module
MTKSGKMADGFGEEASHLIQDLPQEPESWHLKVGRDGRIVIPAAARAQMQLEKGGVVVARLIGGDLLLSSPELSFQKLRAIMANHKQPGVSLVEELLAERRAEQENEDREKF